ncbi:uncharacterized protein LOC123511863 [Portunus trituberculatus]|uniref:Proline-rich transmembrane protein 3/4 domain-containing protein n=1 Tax=Portunus trituberculatus TaxID=210409 RepID=A0A5B7GK51_PORTR|nr:uncharacterized protein LOC123511863 [Portunus trituberculatus]MPC60501.1 hypothetical protein [Portunus trituberculatus]
MSGGAMLVVGGLVLLTWAPTCSRAQVGLRTAPLTAQRTRDNSSSDGGGGVGLFSSKWNGREVWRRADNATSIESSLAAIFRGVAYGVPTTTTTTTSSTTTTTSTTTTRPLPSTRATHPPRAPTWEPKELPPRDAFAPQPSSRPAWPHPEVQQKAVTDPRGRGSSRPMQTPYVEAPGLVVPLPGEPEAEVEVVRADVGVGLSKVAWVRALGPAWVAHVYCAAGLYGILALLALLWLARVHAATHLLPRGYYITLHLLMFLAAFLRCVHLLHDPYGAERRLPRALSALVEESGWPCLTAALAVVVLAVVRAWRCPRLLPRRPHAPLALALLTAAHLLASVAAHLTSALVPQHAAPLRAAARAVTAAWGGAVGLGGLLSVWRAARAAGRPTGLLLVRLSRPAGEGAAPQRHARTALLRAARLVLVASLLQAALASLHMYALVGPHYILQLPPAYPWRWLAYQTTCRMLEVLMWVLLGATSLLVAGSSPAKRQHLKGEPRLLAALSCRRCGSCASVAATERVDEVFPAVCQTNQAVRNFTLHARGKGVYQEALAHVPARRANTVRITHKRPSIRKSATLHSATSDIHLLWSQGPAHNGSALDCPSQPATGHNGPPRPSSMLFNDSGFVRFKTQADHQHQQQEQHFVDDTVARSLHSLQKQGEAREGGPNTRCPMDDPPAYEHALHGRDGAASPRSVGSPKYEDPYDNSQLEQLLQRRLGSEALCAGSEPASGTDCSSTDALSPPAATEQDWSKYASTCSSISAANSFDVRMYDDFEVASYYQSPSPAASAHVYASLHRPNARTRLARQRALYGDGEATLRGCEARQAVEQLAALLAPRAAIHMSYGEGRAPRGSDSEPSSSSGRAPRPARGGHAPRRSVPHDLTPDSAVVVDSAGLTDEASGDDGSPPARAGLLTKIVKNNFSLGGGYAPLGSEDLHGLQSLPQTSAPRPPDDRQERVRPCGHRPRRGQREEPPSPTPQRAPVHRQAAGRGGRRESRGGQEDPTDVADGTTQTEPRTWTAGSPSPCSSRPASSLASHSDLPSECVDSEDDLHYPPHTHSNPQRAAWPSPTHLQAAV